MIQNRILWKYLFIVKDKENQDSSQAVFQLCTFVMRQAPYWKFHSGRHQTQSPASRAGLIQARSLNQACVSFVQQSKTSSTFPFYGSHPTCVTMLVIMIIMIFIVTFCGQGVGPVSILLCLFLLIFFFWWFDFYFVFAFWWFWRSWSSSASPLCGEGVGRADEWAGLVYQQIGVSGGPAC